MSCTPQLHLYDHMPQNKRRIEGIDATRVALSGNASPAEDVEASTNNLTWRRTFASWFSRIDAPQKELHDIDAVAQSIRGTAELPGAPMNRHIGLRPQLSSGAILFSSRTNLIRDGSGQVTLTQIKSVGRSKR